MFLRSRQLGDRVIPGSSSCANAPESAQRGGGQWRAPQHTALQNELAAQLKTRRFALGVRIIRRDDIEPREPCSRTARKLASLRRRLLEVAMTHRLFLVVSMTMTLLGATACSGNDTQTTTTPVADTGTEADAGTDSGTETDAVAGTDTKTETETDTEAEADAGLGTTAPFGPACSPTNPNGAAFDNTATGSAPWDKVGDFTVATVDGDVTFSNLWTGCDSYVFVIHHPDPKYAAYAGAVWKTNPTVLFKQAPKNTHWFFMSYDNNAQSAVSNRRDAYLNALGNQPADVQAHWKSRLHFVTTRAWDLPNWIGATLKKQGVFFFTIDRQQRRREVGLVKSPGGNSSASLRYLGLEALSYNWEHKLDQTTAAFKDKTVVTILDKVTVHGGWGYKKHFVDVTLPDAKAMATFDSASLEIAHGCKDGIDKNCPDWDREVSLFVCDTAKNPGVPPPVACTGTDAEPCTCLGADGVERKATRKCAKNGSGYGACGCGCTEMARQISTYKRHGRWLTDISPLLPLIKAGGKQKFAYVTVDKWIVTAKLHLHNAGKATRPTSLVPLWNGGQYHEKYNDAQKTFTVDVPKSTKGAKFVALISGHGSGTDTKNCAEFCAHSHHFMVGAKEFVKNHPLPNEGCLKKINLGVTPNQFGTWPYARAGWCPGWDVKLWSADITAAITPGTKATLNYKSLLSGNNYVPKWTGKGDYKPVIKMRSWIVFEE
jgi:hypothetical protein